MNLAAVPTEIPSCTNCGAQLVSDQRYCLSCGQPVSPVRLAFLDVLEGERRPPSAGALIAPAQVAYAPLYEPSPAGVPGWLRRYSGLFGVLSVLLMAMIVGLLVGHWVTQNSKSSGPQVLKVEGLSAAPGAASTASTPASSTPATSSLSGSKAKEEAEEAKEAASEKAPPPAKAVTVSPSSLQKIGSSTGKKHQEEISKLGSQPIETSGGGSSSPAPSSGESSKPIGGGSKVESIE